MAFWAGRGRALTAETHGRPSGPAREAEGQSEEGDEERQLTLCGKRSGCERLQMGKKGRDM